MKTHIIQLESHDDFVSACDKMNWAKSGRILLVWPEGRSTLNRRLDLTLLKRHSAALGAQLALVSKDSEVRYHAPRLGIPVFKSLSKAQEKNWRTPRRFRQAPSPVRTTEAAEQPAEGLSHSSERRERNTPSTAGPALTPAARLGFFTLGVLALLCITAVLLPRATIEVAPQTQVQDVLINLHTAPGVREVDLSGTVPSRWVNVIVEGRDSVPASGSMLVPERSAAGELVFTNLTDQEVLIPAGTIALTQGSEAVRFAVTQSGKVAAGPNTSIALPAEALEPGRQGNLPAERLTAIEGLIGVQLSVSNQQAMVGGISRAIPAPSIEDQRTLMDRLTASLEATALQELNRGLGAGDVVIPASLELVQTLEESFQPMEGRPAERLELSLRLEYRALQVSGDDLKTLAKAVFDANLPGDKTPIESSLSIENLGEPSSSAGGYAWQMHAYRLMTARIAPGQLVQIVQGRSPGEAVRQMTASLPMDEAPKIMVQPKWWPRLPILPFRIQVVYADPGR